MNQIKANFRDAVIENDYMWFFDNVIQAVCRMKLENHETEIVCRYKGPEKFVVAKLYSINGCLYLISLSKIGVLIYDKRRKLFQEQFVAQNNGKNVFCLSSAFVYRNNIWLLPRRYSGTVYCYDVKCNKIMSKQAYFDKMNEKSVSGVFSPFYMLKGKELWLPVFGERFYAVFNLENDCSRIYELPDKNVSLNSIYFAEKKIWFTDMNKKGIICLEEDGEMKHIAFGEEAKRPYSNIVCAHGKMFFLPRYKNVLLVADNETVTEFNLGYIETDGSEPAEMVHNAVATEEGLYLIPYHAKELFFYHNQEGTVTQIEMMTKEDYETEKIESVLNREGRLKETNDISIRDFFRYLDKN